MFRKVSVLYMVSLLVFGLGVGSFAADDNIDEATMARATENYGKLPLSFIRNDGQMDEKVMFYERGSGHSTFFTKEGVYLQLTSNQEPNDKEQNHIPDTAINHSLSEHKQANLSKLPESKSVLIKLSPIGADKYPEIVVEGMQEGKVNYFIGNDPEEWKTNIPIYGAVVYKDLYNGIDMKFYGNNRQMEYDIIVKPGADLSQVQLSYEGIDGLSIAGNGQMEIALKEGKVIQNKPYCYQEIDGKKVEVNGDFRVLKTKGKMQKKAGGYGRERTHTEDGHKQRYLYDFHIASYDKSHPLIIDPVLVYSTYLGGGSVENGYSIAVDTSGNAYVTGEINSTDFPMVSAIDDSYNGGVSDVFVTKLDASGTSLAYSTYLGGSSGDWGFGIAVDTSGNAYVTGTTSSTDFPTVSAFDDSYNGGVSDVFVTRLDASGTNLTYSTYLGGSLNDLGDGIAVDTSGNAYLTGVTLSTDFPTVSAFDDSHNGGGDVFVTRLNATGTSLAYSTYLGGGSGDVGDSIAVDTSGNAYVTGTTISTDFPTVSAFDDSHNGGGDDAFVTRLDATGTSLTYSTYLGGSSDDFGFGIAVDTSGNAYVTGMTSSTDFPTVSAFDDSYNGDPYDVFVTRLDATGTNLAYSTYLGGGNDDRGYGIAVDTSGNAYVTGETWSTDFPTVSAFDDSFNGSRDVFVTRFDTTGTNLTYSTYLGGGDGERGDGIAIDTSGNAYVTGMTLSTDFPTVSAFDGSIDGNHDAFVTRLSTCTYSISPTTNSFFANGGIGSVIVTALDGCPWTATSNNSWITIDSGNSGTGDGTANYSVASNTGAGLRTGTMFIAGKTFTLIQAGTDPFPDIKANGSDWPFTLGTSDTLSINVTLVAGSSLGVDSDWWAAAATPFGWYYFDVGIMNWVFAGVSYTDLTPAYQGLLFDLSTFEVLNMSSLPVGTYTFYFAVDTNMNGSLDFDQFYFDSVFVNITP